MNVKKYYKLSGSQGLAAVAYGTETVKKVDAIASLGNNYTQMAKKCIICGKTCRAIFKTKNHSLLYVMLWIDSEDNA
ncbi:MAG: histidinol dehydrogenase [Lachnospiraceae bacterium]|nr:histidinol dehydrogenase [Lachnospiraceae bacterium]